MSTSLFLETLRRADLEHFYPSFTSHGITQLEELMTLSMQDFNTLGVKTRDDRQRLFELIQAIRDEYESLHGSGSSTNNQRLRLNSSSSDRSNNSGHAVSNSISGSNNAVGSGRRPSRSQSSSNNSSSTNLARQEPPSPRSYDSGNDSGYFPSRNTSGYVPGSVFDQRQEPEEEEEAPKVRSRPTLNAYGMPKRSGSTSGHGKSNQGSISLGGGGGSSNTSTADKRKSNTEHIFATRNNTDLMQKIRVCVRKRPLNKKEVSKSEADIIDIISHKRLAINEAKVKLDLSKFTEQHQFIFDEVFESTDDNEDVYKRTALPLVEYVFEGGKATCFAYGQTGSGKTHTMLNMRSGLYVLAATDMFYLLKEPEYSHLSAYVSFFEIYQGALYDLLNRRRKLFAREDGKQRVQITGLQEYMIESVDQLLEVFEYGSNNRSTGTTGANSDSSRSHAILQITLKFKDNKKRIHGKFSFIDLAGSERGADRGETNKQTRMEGSEINKSLLALKECIRALDLGKSHLPFRQSVERFVYWKVTYLHDCNGIPSAGSCEHTLNTLRYADRVKELKNDKPSARTQEEPRQEPSFLRKREQAEAAAAAEAQQQSHDYDDYEDDDDDDLMDQELPVSELESLDIADPDDYDPQNDEEYNAPDIYEQPLDDYKPTIQYGSYSGNNGGNGSSSSSSSRNQNSNNNNNSSSSSRIQNIPAGIGSRSKLPTSSSSTSLSSASQLRPPGGGNGGSSQLRSPSQSPALRPIDTSPSLEPVIQSSSGFTPHQMEEFIRAHRAQIREITECIKHETKLMANFTLSMANGAGQDPDQIEEIAHGFEMYIDELDAVLGRKLQVVNELRKMINHMTSY
ncbi:P-loop containing nucleoside triphosphate hydrolase protein [Syncephalis plumigaleata]|nr:P-loop containing nucleoside triphosphate hydrolase protein [Syncephalis plumigaleata]